MAKLNKEQSVDRNQRESYLAALGQALGVDQQIAVLNAEVLIDKFEESEDLWLRAKGKDRYSIDPELAERVENIGERFLRESDKRFAGYYFLGSWVLALLNEDPGSGYFLNLDGYVDYWTDGQAGGKFRELIGK